MFIIVFLVGLPFFCHAANIDNDIVEFYSKADYATTVKLIEQQIEQVTEKISKGEKVNLAELYSKYLLLAHVYAWKMNNTDEALKQYQNAIETRPADTQGKKMPPIEFVFIAEIYENKGNLLKAKKYYQNLLNELIARKESEGDDVSIIINEDLTKFTKYQIDSINLKENRKNFKPLLAKLKLTSTSIQTPVYQMLPFLLGPAAMLEIANIEKQGIIAKTDLAAYIRQCQSNISSMVLNYMLILNFSASSVTESSEKAMQAYVSKYHESYYSLLLRQMFYKFYKENDRNEKAKQLLTEIKSITEKRKMELITGPDKRFASPEKTWEIYKKALIEGDLDSVMECYVPGQQRYKQVYTVLGKEKMKEIGKDMGNIIRVSGGEREAIYEILRKENGKKYSYEIRFYNIDGEWKMEEF